MIKKVTLLVLVVFSTSVTFLSCSTDDDSSEQSKQTSYAISPPTWLQGTWKNSNDDQFTFTTDDIQFSDIEGGSWKFLHNTWKQTINNNKSKFYDKSKTDNYYEAEFLYYEGFLDTNIKVNKTATNTIAVTYTFFEDDGSIINVENYSLTKSN